jgi:hypothetical protein
MGCGELDEAEDEGAYALGGPRGIEIRGGMEIEGGDSEDETSCLRKL